MKKPVMKTEPVQTERNIGVALNVTSFLWFVWQLVANEISTTFLMRHKADTVRLAGRAKTVSSQRRALYFEISMQKYE